MHTALVADDDPGLRGRYGRGVDQRDAVPRPDDLAASLVALPDLCFTVPGTSRTIAVDLVGDATDPAVLYLHGTPDSRRARHPDPAATVRAGVRLVAVDRPGFGGTTFDPAATQRSFAADLVALLDHLQLRSVAVLAWSAGATWALALAARAPERVETVTIVGGLVPIEAFDDPDVVASAGDTRLGMVDAARELGPAEAGALIGGMLLPDPLTFDLAVEHLRSIEDPADPTAGNADDHRTSLAGVPGALTQMALALCDAGAQGIEGVCLDVALQYRPLEVTLRKVHVPTRLIYGAHDTTCPPEFGAWFQRHLPNAALHVLADDGHLLLLPHWTAILRSTQDPDVHELSFPES